MFQQFCIIVILAQKFSEKNGKSGKKMRDSNFVDGLHFS